MNVTKKSVVLLLVSVMLVQLFVGCGKSDEKEQSKVEGKEETVVELSFYIWDDEEPYISDVVNAYNAQQEKVNVNLTVIPAANDEYDNKLTVLMSAGQGVDIVDIRGMAQVTAFAENGSLLDITDMIENSALDTEKYGPQWKVSKNNGRNYALPTRSTCWALFYNADLFDQAGLEYPEQLTWDEYGELSKVLKEKLGTYGGYWVPWVMPFAAIQKGTYVNSEDMTNLAYSLELLDRFYNKDASHMNYGEIIATSADFLAEFENGNAVMLPNGEWTVQMLMADEAAGNIDMNWQIAPMPVPDGVEAGTTWGQFQFAGIASSTAHPQEAFDFLQYLCGEEGSVIYSENGMIHAYANENASETFQETVGKESVSVFFNSKIIQEQPNISGYNEILSAFNEHAELYLLEEKTIEETMEAFKKQRETIIQKYNN